MAPLPPPPPPPPQLPPPAAPAATPGLTIVTNTYDHEVSRWGLGDVALAMLMFVVVGTAIGLLAGGTDPDVALEGAWLPAALTIPPVFVFCFVLWLARARGAGLGADFQFRFRRYDLLAGLALWLSAWILAIVALLVMIALGGEAPSAAAADLAIDSGEESGVTVWILLFAIFGATLIPVVEELLFRGLFWSALEKRGVHNVISLLITSVSFAAFHFELSRFPILFVIGLAFGVGRLATGRIAASILAHGLVNAFGMVAVLLELS